MWKHNITLSLGPTSVQGFAVDSVVESAKSWVQHLRKQEDVDVVLALTHQSMQADHALAKTGLFPVIFGGHEHELMQVSSLCSYEGTFNQTSLLPLISLCRMPLRSCPHLVSVTQHK